MRITSYQLPVTKLNANRPMQQKQEAKNFNQSNVAFLGLGDLLDEGEENFRTSIGRPSTPRERDSRKEVNKAARDAMGIAATTSFIIDDPTTESTLITARQYDMNSKIGEIYNKNPHGATVSAATSIAGVSLATSEAANKVASAVTTFIPEKAAKIGVKSVIAGALTKISGEINIHRIKKSRK